MSERIGRCPRVRGDEVMRLSGCAQRSQGRGRMPREALA